MCEPRPSWQHPSFDLFKVFYRLDAWGIVHCRLADPHTPGCHAHLLWSLSICHQLVFAHFQAAVWQPIHHSFVTDSSSLFLSRFDFRKGGAWSHRKNPPDSTKVVPSMGIWLFCWHFSLQFIFLLENGDRKRNEFSFLFGWNQLHIWAPSQSHRSICGLTAAASH